LERHVVRIGEKRNTYKIVVETSKGMRLRGICSRRWEDNIKVDFKAIVWEVEDWIYLAQRREQWLALVNTIMFLWVP
jgi:hypothetical protein